MDDRELLEAAAKAAGWERMPAGTVDKAMAGWLDPVTGRMHWDDTWNPLTDDGDALRLAVKLRLDIDFAPKATWLGTKKDAPVPLTFENHKDDPYAATRRAIVRAAAALTSQEPPTSISEG